MLPFNNLLELTTKFSDESVCRQYLEDMMWQGNPTCPHCGFDKPYKLKDGKNYRCSNDTCKSDFSVTVGTIFENTKVPLSKWFMAIYLTTNHKKGISSLQLARDISVARKTAWFMLHRIREMAKPKEQVILKDEVMIDQTWHGGKMKNKSVKKRIERRVQEERGYNYTEDKIPVFGLVQKGGNVVMRVVPDEKEKTLTPIIIELVDKDTVIVSDGGTMFSRLDQDFTDHVIVNHSQGQYVNGAYTTNHIESVFALVKRTVYGTYHNVSGKHLERYCTEIAHRYNTRKIKDNERFVATVKNARGRLKYDQLIGKSNKLAS